MINSKHVPVSSKVIYIYNAYGVPGHRQTLNGYESYAKPKFILTHILPAQRASMMTAGREKKKTAAKYSPTFMYPHI